MTHRERAIRIACGFAVLLQPVRYYATLPLVGFLLPHPLLHEVARPSEIAIIVGAAYSRVGLEPAWAVVVLGLVGLSYADPLRWLAGHRYGDRATRRLLRSRPGLADALETATRRWGTWALVLGWYTPVPIWLIQLAAGTSGMRFRRFVVADLGGTLLYVGLLFGLGYAVGSPAVDAAQRVARDATYVGVAVVALAVAAWGLRRCTRPRPTTTGLPGAGAAKRETTRRR